MVIRTAGHLGPRVILGGRDILRKCQKCGVNFLADKPDRKICRKCRAQPSNAIGATRHPA